MLNMLCPVCVTCIVHDAGMVGEDMLAPDLVWRANNIPRVIVLVQVCIPGELPNVKVKYCFDTDLPGSICCLVQPEVH